MGRAPCCDKANVKRGPWAPEEDATLKNYVEKHGTGDNWIALPQKAGLKRCGKSCRLRWLNYLRPDIKHGGFTEEEDNIICSVYKNIGSRWSVIASYLPGRTDNDVKNYWNTKLKKKLLARNINIQETTVKSKSKSLEINTASVTPLMKTGSYDFEFSSFGNENSTWKSTESSFGYNLDFSRFITDHLEVPLPVAVNETYVLSESQEMPAISSLPVDNSPPFWSNYEKIEEDLFIDIFPSYGLPNAGDINQQFLQNFPSSTDYDNHPQELYQSPMYY